MSVSLFGIDVSELSVQYEVVSEWSESNSNVTTKKWICEDFSVLSKKYA